MERVKINTRVAVMRNGVELTGYITAIGPELTYTLTLDNGDERSIDHCDIIEEITTAKINL